MPPLFAWCAIDAGILSSSYIADFAQLRPFSEGFFIDGHPFCRPPGASDFGYVLPGPKGGE
jgi:hypothetical protein